MCKRGAHQPISGLYEAQTYLWIPDFLALWPRIFSMCATFPLFAACIRSCSFPILPESGKKSLPSCTNYHPNFSSFAQGQAAILFSDWLQSLAPDSFDFSIISCGALMRGDLPVFFCFWCIFLSLSLYFT